MVKSPQNSVAQSPKQPSRSKTAEGETAFSQADRVALRNILAGGLGGLSLGALFRGVKAVPEVFQGPAESSIGSLGPTVVRVQDPDPEKRDMRARPLSWIEPAALIGGKRAEHDMLSDAANALYDNGLKHVLPSLDFPGGTTMALAKPWHAPAFVGLTAAGAGAGWKLMDWLADSRRKSMRDSDLASAEQDYMNALHEMRGTKMAALDEAHELCKTAIMSPPIKPLPPAAPAAPAPQTQLPRFGLWQDAKDLGGMTTNGLLGLMTLTALQSAALAHGYVRNSSDSRALQEALAARQRHIYARNPSPPQLVLEDDAEGR